MDLDTKMVWIYWAKVVSLDLKRWIFGMPAKDEYITSPLLCCSLNLLLYGPIRYVSMTSKL